MNQKTEINVKSKRIASNTLLLFLRMFAITIINLYAVRLVLRGLGVVDYGIFNTIAGVITLSTFISATLSVAVQRFYSYAIGERNTHILEQIFPASVNLIIVLSFIIIILAETVGLWFVSTQLTIPPERMTAALIIYQLALIVLLLSFLQIPFSAAIFAHEDMGIYTLISTTECLLRLAAAWLITMSVADHLIVYSSGLLVAAIVVFLMYVGVALWKYKECRYRKVTEKGLYKQISSFSGWTLFGSAAHTGMIQGSIILLNIFFGPALAAAFAVAQQINNAFNSLCSSIVLAFRPAMIKAYAEKNYTFLDKLFMAGNKFLLYALTAVVLPIYAEMDIILRTWLGDEVTDDTILFSRLIILYIVCQNMHSPITIIMQASGRIREYHLPVESISLLCLPVAWLLFRIGFQADSILYTMIALCIIAHVVRLFCLKKYYPPFTIRDYTNHLLFPAIAIILPSALATWGLHTVVDNSLWRFIVVSLCSPAVLLLLVYLIGISRQEREVFKNMLQALKRNKSHQL